MCCPRWSTVKSRQQVASKSEIFFSQKRQKSSRQPGSSKLEFSRKHPLALLSAHESLTSHPCLWIPATCCVAHTCRLKITSLQCKLGIRSWQVYLVSPLGGSFSGKLMAPLLCTWTITVFNHWDHKIWNSFPHGTYKNLFSREILGKGEEFLSETSWQQVSGAGGYCGTREQCEEVNISSDFGLELIF